MTIKPDKYSVVGKRLPRVDAAIKATGEANFSEDIILPGMLFAKVLRSPHAHAKILNIDTSRAEKLPGVKAILLNKDTEGIYAAPDETVLATDKVRFVGDEVAAVAAVDEDTAIEALGLIKVDYEPLPAVFDMEEALKKESPKVHEFYDDNIPDNINVSFGNVEEGFARSEYIREDRFVINPTHSCFSEHHMCVAYFDSSGKLTVWTPIQSSHFIQKNMAYNFKLPENKVRIKIQNVGGAFCGRGSDRTYHYIAALLSKKTGRPVKLRFTSDEEFLVYRGGGKYIMDFKTGVKKDGSIQAVYGNFTIDSGAYLATQFIVLRFLALNLQMLYKVNNAKCEGKLVYTNNPPYFFHHGAGMVAMRFAFGSQLDQIAQDLGIDPVEMNLKNAVTKGYTTPSKIHYASCGLSDCIKKTAKQSNWKKKYGKLPKLRGIGIGCGMIRSGGKGMFLYDTSAAFLKIQEDGTVHLFTGLPDMGQGSYTAMAQIAAETLGIRLEDIIVIAGDTEVTPLDIGAISQRGTFTTGNAVKAAALDARGQIAKLAAGKLETKPSNLIFRDGKISVKNNPEKAMNFSDAISEALNSTEGRYVMGRGFYNPPITAADPKTLEGNSSLAYSFGAQIAEVEVDPETGFVKLLKMTAAHDVGFAINPMAVEGQMEGQIFSGMGQTLYEECLMENGQVLNPSLLDYRTPRPLEIPEMESIIVESNDPYGPYGAKEVGQGPIQCTSQAIANAVSNAIGVRIKEVPITPERVLAALRSKDRDSCKP